MSRQCRATSCHRNDLTPSEVTPAGSAGRHLVTSRGHPLILYYTGDNMTGAKAAEVEMINYAWTKEDLDANTIEFAERIANGSADHLAVLKLTMNRFYENMGIYPSVRSATEQNALAQMTEWTYSFGESIPRTCTSTPTSAAPMAGVPLGLRQRRNVLQIALQHPHNVLPNVVATSSYRVSASSRMAMWLDVSPWPCWRQRSRVLVFISVDIRLHA